jgi:molecular chaperone GrpE
MVNPFDDDEMSGGAGEAVADGRPAEGVDPKSDAQVDPLSTLQQEKAAIQDRLLRLAAEFENYRKRVDRDRRDQADAAVANAVEELLPIIDNLERALEAPVGSDAEVYRRGVQLIHQQMVDLLRKRGVTPIESVGAEFDPNVHQAVAHEASSEHREGEVMEEFRRGYKLGDRLLRPAMVKVAKA